MGFQSTYEAFLNNAIDGVGSASTISGLWNDPSNSNKEFEKNSRQAIADVINLVNSTLAANPDMTSVPAEVFDSITTSLGNIQGHFDSMNLASIQASTGMKTSLSGSNILAAIHGTNPSIIPNSQGLQSVTKQTFDKDSVTGKWKVGMTDVSNISTNTLSTMNVSDMINGITAERDNLKTLLAPYGGKTVDPLSDESSDIPGAPIEPIVAHIELLNMSGQEGHRLVIDKHVNDIQSQYFYINDQQQPANYVNGWYWVGIPYDPNFIEIAKVTAVITDVKGNVLTIGENGSIISKSWDTTWGPT